jgi:hypothetical protein
MLCLGLLQRPFVEGGVLKKEAGPGRELVARPLITCSFALPANPATPGGTGAARHLERFRSHRLAVVIGT